MEKKPITSKEAAKLLAEFIAKNWICCPVDECLCVPDCGGWGCEMCSKCLRKHAESIK